MREICYHFFLDIQTARINANLCCGGFASERYFDKADLDADVIYIYNIYILFCVLYICYACMYTHMYIYITRKSKKISMLRYSF